MADKVIRNINYRSDTRKLILLVDDSAILLRNMKNLLEVKYKIAFAVSGAQCMKVLEMMTPDLIILDYDMPVCDGRKTLMMIREQESSKDIPVIFLTGVSDRDNIEAVLSLRPQGYFLKPPATDRLMEAIEKLIGP